jgi:hypothetical protein
MNGCPDEHQLRRLLAGELPGDSEQALTAHLDACPPVCKSWSG